MLQSKLVASFGGIVQFNVRQCMYSVYGQNVNILSSISELLTSFVKQKIKIADNLQWIFICYALIGIVRTLKEG